MTAAMVRWIAAATILAGSCSFCSGSRGGGLREGEYLREDYTQALCKTLSPLRAGPVADNQFQAIGVARDRKWRGFHAHL